jgi:hypothetical protein
VASATGTIVAVQWVRPGSWTSSISSARASVAFTSAAFWAGTLPACPISPASGIPPQADAEVVDFRAAVCRGRGDRRADGIEYQQLRVLDG